MNSQHGTVSLLMVRSPRWQQREASNPLVRWTVRYFTRYTRTRAPWNSLLEILFTGLSSLTHWAWRETHAFQPIHTLTRHTLYFSRREMTRIAPTKLRRYFLFFWTVDLKMWILSRDLIKAANMFTSNLRCVFLGRSQTGQRPHPTVDVSNGNGEVEPSDCTVWL